MYDKRRKQDDKIKNLIYLFTVKPQNDNIKKLLYNYPKYDTWINNFENELEQIRERIRIHYEVGVSKLSDMPHGTGTADNTYQAVENADKYKEVYLKRANKIADDIAEYYVQKELIEWLLPQLKPIHQDIVEMRYFKRMKWKDIYNQDQEQRLQAAWDKEHKLLFIEIKKLLKEKEGL